VKRTLTVLIMVMLLASCQNIGAQGLSVKDLTQYWDTITPLANPHKGWYHHLYDNSISNYAIKNQKMLDTFPGMDHMYLRLAWSFLEPEEGRFDWTLIDEVIEKYVPRGYGISFRITCKETGDFPKVVGQQQDGVNFATPIWVKDAGAKGTVTEAWNMKSWSPDWDDPIFLEKLDNFHKAFAARYDGQAFLRYSDVGSIGDWGEGHTSFSTKTPPTVAEVKAHMDMYYRYYKNSSVVVTDDLLYFGKTKEEGEELLNYALSLNFSLRDDSPLVDWYIQEFPDSYSVSHPHFFESVYLTNPVIFELQHYHMVKRDGNWIGRNGADPIPRKSTSGADLFRGALRATKASYIGYHGHLEEWLKDNPELTGELLNLSGYWFFPLKAIYLSSAPKDKPYEFSLEWVNKGVAKAYHNYILWLKLEGNNKQHIIKLDNANPINWLSDPVLEKYTIHFPEDITAGQYLMKIKFTTTSEEFEDIKLGLDHSLQDENNFYEIFTLNLKK